MSGQTPVRPASAATGITDAEVEAALAGWKYFTDQYGLAYPMSAMKTALAWAADVREGRSQ